ncbi:hypothetical protein BI049_gp247 [Salmonella phage vB_SnwM_CGG4-1]|uniref:Uncharacterized protein n=1 Tax=Salmonella phage vB_SnwM_CGG4-1 TaxID=1815631 RepID=A0A1B0VVE8_9CAUD|nr:hypothetical protein BI049_gp247 [Salmonella phage vB_SnwM_CGG4-1]ANA49486.1 hypothetical protein CGG41_131 [Salmonella phage vB_SnwM_CGG4-1]
MAGIIITFLFFWFIDYLINRKDKFIITTSGEKQIGHTTDIQSNQHN